MLAERIHVRKATAVARLAERVPATFMVFDLLSHDGEDLTSRRSPIAASGSQRSTWAVRAGRSRARTTTARCSSSHPLAQGLEGIVSKRLDSRYRPGERTRHWLKFAHRHRASYVVGGWRPQVGGTHLAALLVGEPTAEAALPGRVGSGIGPSSRAC